jgi:hypothetical protein
VDLIMKRRGTSAALLRSKRIISMGSARCAGVSFGRLCLPRALAASRLARVRSRISGGAETGEGIDLAAGDGQRISAGNLRRAIEQSVGLHRSKLRYAHTFLVQTARTAFANGRRKLEERLARWLLMADGLHRWQ